VLEPKGLSLSHYTDTETDTRQFMFIQCKRTDLCIRSWQTILNRRCQDQWCRIDEISNKMNWKTKKGAFVPVSRTYSALKKTSKICAQLIALP